MVERLDLALRKADQRRRRGPGPIRSGDTTSTARGGSAKPPEELGAARQQCHQVARGEARRRHELAGPLQAIASEGGELLVRAVRHEDDADGQAQSQRAKAGFGGHHAVSRQPMAI